MASSLVIGLATASSADVKIAASQLPPGTYRTSSYTTRFDGEGTWSTTSNAQTVGQGHYRVDDGVVFFTTTPAGCPQERVRYRLAPSPDGFRLHFLEDTCGRSKQMDDIVFVRVQRSN